MPDAPAALDLEPARRQKLAETVAEQLLSRIRAGRLAPGTRIPSERELMAALGVGRSTIREALHGLALLGVIDIRHGQGAFVADRPAVPQTPAAIEHALRKGVTRDLLEARGGMELLIAELAAARRTDADLRELEAVLELAAQAVAEGRVAARHSAQFHLELAEAAHNEVLAGFVRSIVELLAERGPVLERQPGYAEWELAEHRALYEAVKAGDRALAVERMRAHLAAMMDHHTRAGLA